MNSTDLFALLPIIIVAGASIAVMLSVAVKRDHLSSLILTLMGLGASFVSLFFVADIVPRNVTPLLVFDGYSLFFMGLIFSAGFLVALLSYGYLEAKQSGRGEYYILLMLAVSGAAVLASSAHYASFFLGLEILNISLYALIAFPRDDKRCIESATKYLILAAASDSFLLFGMALVYSQLGTMQFGLQALRMTEVLSPKILFFGHAVFIVGFGFKLALAPLHMWIADVYEGAPAPVTAFLATVSKGAVFAAVFRYFSILDLQAYFPLWAVLYTLGAASMFVGNLLALMQNNVKRLLAYSSIAHMGYIFVAFLAGGDLAGTAIIFYWAAYFVTTLGAFGVVTVLSGPRRDAGNLDGYRGLLWNRPWLATIFIGMLLSLAGIPLTAGFIGKFFVMSAAVGSAMWVPVILLVINSIIGLFYYLRIIVMMYVQPSGPARPSGPWNFGSFSAGFVLVFLLALLICMGVYPSPLIAVIQTSLAGFAK